MVVVILLESVRHCPTGVGDKVYFKELEIRLNNVILVEKNGYWVIATEDDELKNISLSNVTVRKSMNNIDEQFDLVIEHHSDGGARRN